MPTKYELHVRKWHDCKQCDLHLGRTNVVFARGSVPCDILFIGEGPGASEDILGAPFVGPAGHLMDEIIRQAVPSNFSYALTNLVCCIPRSEEDDTKVEPPGQDSIDACSERLVEFVEICDPKLIVAVGATSRDNLDPKYSRSIQFHEDIPQIDIQHPAAILRMNVAQQGLSVHRAVVIIRDAVEEL